MPGSDWQKNNALFSVTRNNALDYSRCDWHFTRMIRERTFRPITDQRVKISRAPPDCRRLENNTTSTCVRTSTLTNTPRQSISSDMGSGGDDENGDREDEGDKATEGAGQKGKKRKRGAV